MTVAAASHMLASSACRLLTARLPDKSVLLQLARALCTASVQGTDQDQRKPSPCAAAPQPQLVRPHSTGVVATRATTLPTSATMLPNRCWTCCCLGLRTSWAEDILFPSQLRDFLHDSLYHPSEGYFNAREPPVGVGVPLDLPALAGEDAYRAEVRRQYDDLAARRPCRATRRSARAS